MIRIVGGQFRGRRLKTMGSNKGRPTSHKLRETLFDILGPHIQGACFVDLFAGSGAVGIEALSRGAREAIFVESNRQAVNCLRANLLSLEIASKSSIIQMEVQRAISCIGEFDFCFIDPPYGEALLYRSVMETLGSRTNWKSHAWVIVEHSKHFSLDESFGALRCVRRVRQGDSVLSFFHPPPVSA